MIKRTLWTTLLILCSFSCVRTPQKGAESRFVDAPEMFANDSLRATFYYTEAVKSAALGGDTTQTVVYLKKVLEIDSLHAPAHYQLGVLYHQSNPTKALSHSETAYSVDSTNLDYLYQYGHSLAVNGEYEKARAFQLNLIAKDPKNISAYYNAAVLYAYTGMPHMAISLLDSAEYKLGRDERLVKMRQEILMMVGQKDRALEELQKECANNPYDPNNWAELCKLLLETGKMEEADEAYRKAVELAPNNLEIQLSLCLAFHDAGGTKQFFELAKALFLNDKAEVNLKLFIIDEAVANNVELYKGNFYPINTLYSILNIKYPNHTGVMERYAEHLIYAGEGEKSLELYKCLAATPDYQKRKSAYFTIIQFEEFLGRTDSMELYLDKMIELYPKDSSPYMYKAMILEGRGDTKGAEKFFRKAVEVSETPESKSLAYVTLADHIADHQNNIKKACRYYRKAVNLNPENATALNNWAYFSSINNGNLEEALERSTKACELEPSNYTFLDTKAWILHLLGRNKEAMTIMKQAISLDTSNDSTLLLHYADILAADGEGFLAEIYYKRALDAGEDAELIESRIEKLK